MIRAVTKTLIEKTPRLTPEGGPKRKAIDLTRGDTPLAAEMDDIMSGRFLQQVVDEWGVLHGGLDQWRGEMKKWEHMSNMDYSDRVGTMDPNNPEPVLDVFSYQNDTLGTSEGFVDFAAAQAKDDIFGTKPWLAATPEGRQDPKLADQVTKHSQWKLNQSDLEQTVKDAIRIACWGGTVFCKARWEKETETFKKASKPAAFSKETGGAYKNGNGDLVFTAEELVEMKVDGNDVVWKPQTTEETITVYDNARTACLDYNDVAFDNKAPELDLAYTPFYSRFRMGILDAIAYYKIPAELHKQLEFALVGSNEEARTENGESNVTPLGDDAFESNTPISLVEGFRRCDPFRTGKPIRVHFVFSPTLHILFKIDYLANETPGGMLPVFPIRIHKKPRRIFGVGYFEKYENSNNSVDRQHNAVLYRNKLSANVVTGIHKSALANPQDNSFTIDSRKPIELAEDKKLADFIEFTGFPDFNQRSVELMNQQLQMMQMRSGITSAAQGELKGVPNASTATGVNQLTSRGALLLKDPISQITDDVQPFVEYNVLLLYANHDREETFVYGEGENAELLTIKPGDVQGLRMNVTLKLVQSQNQQKLANAQAGMQALASYSALPEMDKTAARGFTVQALESLGFSQAEDLVREAVTDPAGILALLPPDVAPIIEAALVQAGLMAPTATPAEGGKTAGSAPVTPSVGAVA